MMKLKTVFTAAAVTVSLSGCMTLTSGLWDRDDIVKTKTTHHKVGEDKIHSFGVVNKANSQLAKDSLVMMGEKYWFVVNPGDSAKLTEILNVKLPKQFQLVKYRKDSVSSAYAAMPVTLTKPGSADFESDFCLRYDAADAQEAATLEALSFRADKKISEHAYFRCISAAGKYYATPQNIKAAYRFERSVPVEISYVTTKENIKGFRVLGNILLTPLALTGDVAGNIVILPLFMMGVFSIT